MGKNALNVCSRELKTIDQKKKEKKTKYKQTNQLRLGPSLIYMR